MDSSQKKALSQAKFRRNSLLAHLGKLAIAVQGLETPSGDPANPERRSEWKVLEDRLSTTTESYRIRHGELDALLEVDEQQALFEEDLKTTDQIGYLRCRIADGVSSFRSHPSLGLPLGAGDAANEGSAASSHGAQYQGLPKLKLPQFSGNHLEWRSFLALITSETPVMVPPVPTPATNTSILPSVASQISSAVVRR